MSLATPCFRIKLQFAMRTPFVKLKSDFCGSTFLVAAGGRAMKQKLYIFLIIFLIALKIFLVRNQPVFAIVSSPYDDYHFLTQARSILAGDWLGDYNQLTLIKGPFFPLWIVFTFLLGMPLLLSEQLLYILSCLVLIVALRPILHRRRYALILFCTLLFNPFTYDAGLFTRVTRDALYESLSLLVFTCMVAIFLRRPPPRQNLVWVIGLGLSLSAAALTREETVWFFPLILVGFLASSLGIKGDWPLRLATWSIVPIIYLLAIGTISFINYRYYSIFNVTEMDNADFVAAFSALNRVKPDKVIPMVPVSHDARVKIYAISPAFKELEPYLDGDLGKGWAAMVSSLGVVNAPSNEIPGGWFMWAFRDAVAAAGHYSSGKYPVDYYRALANEVNSACDTGKLVCSLKPASLAPAWNQGYIIPVLDSFKTGISDMVSFKNFSPYPIYSLTDSGPGEMLFRDLTQSEISKPPVAIYKVSGWFVGLQGTPEAVIAHDDKIKAVISQDMQSPDIYNYLLSMRKVTPSAQTTRFTITSPCESKCFFELRDNGKVTKSINLDGFSHLIAWNDKSTIGAIESVEIYAEDLVYQNKYNHIKMDILEKVGQLYQSIFPLLAGLAVVAFIMITILAKNFLDDWAILVAGLIMIVSRIGLLSIINVTSFPAFNSLYLSPAYPLFILTAILALFSAWKAIIAIFPSLKFPA